MREDGLMIRVWVARTSISTIARLQTLTQLLVLLFLCLPLLFLYLLCLRLLRARSNGS